MTKNKHLGRDVIEISRKLKKKRKYELTWPIPEKWPAPDKQEDSRERRRGLSEARAREGISSKWSIRKKEKGSGTYPNLGGSTENVGSASSAIRKKVCPGGRTPL